MLENVVSHCLLSLIQIRIEGFFAGALKTEVTHLWVAYLSVTLGMHQPEVHFCLFEKLFLIFTSKYLSLDVILLLILTRTESP